MLDTNCVSTCRSAAEADEAYLEKYFETGDLDEAEIIDAIMANSSGQ